VTAASEDAKVLALAIDREDRMVFFYKTVLATGRLTPAAQPLARALSSNHQAHRAALADASGGVGTPRDAYPLPADLNDETAVVRRAAEIEESGMQAHLKALAVLIAPAVRTVLASIVGVQAQHVTVLRSWQRLDPVPGAFLTDGLGS
jgi:hypothetical protein